MVTSVNFVLPHSIQVTPIHVIGVLVATCVCMPRVVLQYEPIKNGVNDLSGFFTSFVELKADTPHVEHVKEHIQDTL